jgi:hypothetical protein
VFLVLDFAYPGFFGDVIKALKPIMDLVPSPQSLIPIEAIQETHSETHTD